MAGIAAVMCFIAARTVFAVAGVDCVWWQWAMSKVARQGAWFDSDTLLLLILSKRRILFELAWSVKPTAFGAKDCKRLSAVARLSDKAI